MWFETRTSMLAFLKKKKEKIIGLLFYMLGDIHF